jgi:hypothetical protein
MIKKRNEGEIKSFPGNKIAKGIHHYGISYKRNT